MKPTWGPATGTIQSYWNNATDGSEGARYRNAFGTYLHGSLLPKNPTLTDALIKAGLERRHGREILLAPIDDVVEDAAHDNAVKVAAGRSRRA